MTRRTDPQSRLTAWRPLWTSTALIAALLAIGACAEKAVTARAPDDAPPPTVFTGPAFLHGTVGSMARVAGNEPMPVSGWGFVTALPGTGSPDVPAFMSTWLTNEMRRRGVGSYRLGTQQMSTRELLASEDTAVVRVDGLIPPGAIVGTRFDVLVQALPGTQTTSLADGQLWTTDLSIGGANERMLFSRRLAHARGNLYINPFEDPQSAETRIDLDRRAIIVGGGEVTEPRELLLVLNQPSVQRARLISDRINQRFPHEEANQRFFNTALAKTEQAIQINVPKRYAAHPQRFLSLVAHLYLQRAADFEPRQAERLAEVLAADPTTAERVALAWEALGKTTLPVLRRLYDAGDLRVRLAALEAGARMEDQRAADPLMALCEHDDPAIRARATTLLAPLHSNIRVTRALVQRLDDPVDDVRLAAYETLVNVRDPVVDRVPIHDGQQIRYMLDLAPATTRPLVYIRHDAVPRVAAFNPYAPLPAPMTAQLWDNRLMIRTHAPDEPVRVFYQPRTGPSVTLEAPPTLAHLVRLLGSPPNVPEVEKGLGLSYSDVCRTLHQLDQQGLLGATLTVRASALAQELAEVREREQTEQMRPELSEPDRPTEPETPLSGN